VSEPVPVGTRVRYDGGEWIVRGHLDPRVSDLEHLAAEYPDGTGYELWPAGVLYKFGNRCYSRIFVRRASFEVIPGEGSENAHHRAGETA
jgi:hypothetical protein